MKPLPLLLLAALVLLTAACERLPETAPSPPPAKILAVAAASDLRFALDELIAGFTAERPGVVVKPTYGSSGNLCAQIEHGAPFDLFLAADIAYPRRLIDSGAAGSDSLFLYATGHLVVWTPVTTGIDVERLGAEALLDPRVRKVALANPEHAPYGRAAEAALRSLGVYNAVAPRLVLGENIAQTAQFVETGAAEVGLIALSLALAPPLREKGRYWEVPENAFPRLDQGGVVLTRAASPELAAAFREWMRSAPARAILARYGFVLPSETTP